MSPAGGTLRPVGLLLLMLGFGLRLDSPWQGLAAVLILAGAALGAAGLWPLVRRASVPPGGEG